MELEFVLRWSIQHDGEAELLDPNVFALLRCVREGGHLAYAAKATGVSYRHAWGLLRAWEDRLGMPLLTARQGRGAHLTEFGEMLLAVAAETEANLTPVLERAALEAAATLSDAAVARRQTVTMASSNSERVRALRDLLGQRHRVMLDVTGSEHALHRYRRGDADIVGFHLPLGELGRSVAAHLISLLDPARDRIWLLERRTLGLLSRKDEVVKTIASLADGRHRFVNRQPGSGTRLIFDGLLGAAGIAPGSIKGYGNEEYTHTAVAAVVASGGADVGFASQSSAKDMKLHFERLIDERFYLAMGRHADSALRRTVAEFCQQQMDAEREGLKADEFTPTVAVLKRIHRAGFWKTAATPSP